jgi:hypothetical protein
MHMSQSSASLPPKSEKVALGSTGSTSRSFFFFTPPGVRAGRSAATSHEAVHWFSKLLKKERKKREGAVLSQHDEANHFKNFTEKMMKKKPASDMFAVVV